jgi:mannose-6-phosphate isomerase-like protein (cupin superfamily)
MWKGGIMALDYGASVLLPGEGKTVSFAGTFSGNRATFVYTEPDSAYSLVEWGAAPGAPGTPLHLHRATDEAFYILECTFDFQAGQRTLELTAGAFVFVPRGWSTLSGTGARPRRGCSQPYFLLASSVTLRNWPKGSRLQVMMRRLL